MDTSTVKVWEEKVVIPTYGIGKPDKNPMFFEKRVYQGSSGVVYPNPVIEKIYDEKEDKEYRGLFLENSYIKIMILPELGGRIQMAYDKIKQRHFIYYNQVVKPALVGLTGPWISGGIEFNWPQHHRPSTFEPVDYTIEENADGSKTVWINEIEKMFHTKGMAGFTLYPGKAYLEIKGKLLNTSPLPQTFLWWANPAVKVNDAYQSVFPPDVNAVFDHGKRDVSTFPIATGTYYKVNYAPGTDISMYKNIPVPTSYMAINSAYDFVGGYEHDSRGGMLHVANHHVSPGKKQWTWGHSDFGQAWDRNLTDEDGPYIELMAGVFTDNQPDFTWLLPNEEKSFTQYFLPYQELGMVKNATKDILLSLVKDKDAVHVKIYGTSRQEVLIFLSYDGRNLIRDTTVLEPGNVYSKTVATGPDVTEQQLRLAVADMSGKRLIKYEPALDQQHEMPASAKPALPPDEIDSNEQLFLTGQHLEQYRHATYSPVPYYEKALERDAGDIRCNNALGLWYLRRGKFHESLPYFQKAIATATQRNPNPYDCEPYYNAGVAYKFIGSDEEALSSFYKAAWDNRWKHSAYFCVAQLYAKKEEWALVLEHINAAISFNINNSKAYVLKAAALRKMKRFAEAIIVCKESLQSDKFNLGALFELAVAYEETKEHARSEETIANLKKVARDEVQNYMAWALDYREAGLYGEAIGLMRLVETTGVDNPMYCYYMNAFGAEPGPDSDSSSEWLLRAAAADPYLCFPNRLEDISILQEAGMMNSADAKATYYLGNLFYDKRQYDDAISNWEWSVRIDDKFPTVLRNLGIAYFNKRNDSQLALSCFEKAFALDKTDARVLMELDQLYKRLNRTPDKRLQFLEANMETVLERDDLYLEHASLLNFKGQHQQALKLIMARKFHPWEGGEGRVSGQYIYSLVEMSKAQIRDNNFAAAIKYLEDAQTYPHNLGEGKLYGAQENDIFYWLGCAHEGLGDKATARKYFIKATEGNQEPAAAVFYNDQQPDKIFYQGLAWRKLGELINADKVFASLMKYGQEHINDEVKLDYFAVSLPNLLVFEDDLTLRNRIHCLFMTGLGFLGLDNHSEARAAFTEVLQLDAEHIKAKTHLLMLEGLQALQPARS